MGVITWRPLAGGWLSGKYRKECDIDLTSGRAQRIPGRFDPSVPGNARKLEIVEELVKIAAPAGISLTHLAIAFARPGRAGGAIVSTPTGYGEAFIPAQRTGPPARRAAGVSAKYYHAGAERIRGLPPGQHAPPD